MYWRRARFGSGPLVRIFFQSGSSGALDTSPVNWVDGAQELRSDDVEFIQRYFDFLSWGLLLTQSHDVLERLSSALICGEKGKTRSSSKLPHW